MRNSALAIPLEPVPLTSDECRVMRQASVKKHHVAMMLLHWFNAVVWLLELLTGMALISSPQFRVVPDWYLRIAEGLFNSRANILQFHIAVGLVWCFVFLVYGIFGWRTYLGREVWQKEIAMDWDDVQWLWIRGRRILGLTRDALPTQGVYNAGQKLFALLVYTMVPCLMVTGIIMAFRLFGPQAVGWSAALHFMAAGLVVSGLMIHVYMGTVFPEEKPAFFSMITGNVNELHVYNHHFKWWREMKLGQQAWEQAHDAAVQATRAKTESAETEHHE